MKSFKELFTQYFSRVCRFALRLTGSEHSAEELTQQTAWPNPLRKNAAVKNERQDLINLRLMDGRLTFCAYDREVVQTGGDSYNKWYLSQAEPISELWFGSVDEAFLVYEEGNGIDYPIAKGSSYDPLENSTTPANG